MQIFFFFAFQSDTKNIAPFGSGLDKADLVPILWFSALALNEALFRHYTKNRQAFSAGIGKLSHEVWQLK